MLLCFSSLSDKGSAAFHLPVLNRPSGMHFAVVNEFHGAGEGAKGAKGIFGCFFLILQERRRFMWIYETPMSQESN
jgi:hypothetical protein